MSTGREPREAERAPSLERQLQAESETLNSVFANATDLIDSGDLDVTLARITERAALQVGAPAYLLAVRPDSDSRIHRHQRGIDEDEAREVAERVMDPDRGPLPGNWLTVPVRSQRNQYGWLVAIYEPGAQFFSQERELLEVYARYAATVNAHAHLGWPTQSRPLPFRPRGRSVIEDPARPSLIALRSRAAFGVGARAELLRAFVGDPGAATAAALSAQTNYGKRNVLNALEAQVAEAKAQ